MDYLRSLYREHVLRIAYVNNWRSGTDEGLPDYRAWMRAEIYLRLDMLIDDLQKAVQTSHIPRGIDAVRELVSLHTDLQVAQAQQTSFAEAVVLLRPVLESMNIPSEVLKCPPHVHHQLQDARESLRIELPPCSEAEWNHFLLKKYQDLYNSQ